MNNKLRKVKNMSSFLYVNKHICIHNIGNIPSLLLILFYLCIYVIGKETKEYDKFGKYLVYFWLGKSLLKVG